MEKNAMEEVENDKIKRTLEYYDKEGGKERNK